MHIAGCHSHSDVHSYTNMGMKHAPFIKNFNEIKLSIYYIITIVCIVCDGN